MSIGSERTGRMRIEPEISGVSVVLLGNFNPAIFTPAWFALHKLLPPSVAETATVEVAHEQICVFSVDWLRLEVSVRRFSAETLQAPYVRLRDLVTSLFGVYLHHTPLKAFAINRTVHFQVASLAERDHIWRTLVPIEPWGTWQNDLGDSGEQGGMTSVTMTQVNPHGRLAGGRINAKVEPSNRIGHGGTGVFVEINDHFALGDTSLETGRQLIQLMGSNFDHSISRSDRIIDHIMSLASVTKV